MASFPKSYRLLNPKDFNYLKSGASYCNTSHLRFYFKTSRVAEEHSRMGLSVSRKVGNAVQRNYVKRFLREKFRQSGVKDLNKDILVIASPRLKTMFADKDSVKNALEHSWKKGIGRIHEMAK